MFDHFRSSRLNSSSNSAWSVLGASATAAARSRRLRLGLAMNQGRQLRWERVRLEMRTKIRRDVFGT